MIKKVYEKLNEDTKMYFNYYKSLGYTDAQSFTLSTVFYGNNRRLSGFITTKLNKKSTYKFCDDYFNFVYENLDKYDTKDICLLSSNGFYGTVASLNDYFVYKGYGEDMTGMNLLGKAKTGFFGHKSKKPAVLDNLFDMSYSDGICGMSAMPSYSKSSVFDSSLSVEAPEESCSDRFAEMDSLEVMAGPESVDGLEGSGVKLQDEYYTDDYETYEENKFKDTLVSPTSTIRMTCNTASMGILKNTLETNPSHLNYSMIRTEEMLNYFTYNFKGGCKVGSRFDCLANMADIPGSDTKLLMVGVQGKDYDLSLTKQNVAILLDVSGSMFGNTKATQPAIFTIISKLKKGDRLSLVTYSDSDTTLLKNMKVKDETIDEIIENIYSINITGCTYGSAGINASYSLLEKSISDRKKEEKKEFDTNRIFLITDGDLNFGVTTKGGLEELIKEKKKTGIYLSVIGTGTSNYDDSILETLAKNGNGNYTVVNSLSDVNTAVNLRYNQMAFTVAKDVKAQIEFNPKFIKSYKLIGYENRQLSHEEFKDDTVISEPFGSNSAIVVLYEVVLTDNKNRSASEYKYQKPEIIDSSELFTIKLRYRESKSADNSPSVEEEIPFEWSEVGESDDNIGLAMTIWVLADIFKGKNISNTLTDYVIVKLTTSDFGKVYNYSDNAEKIDLLKELYNNYRKK